MDRLTTSQAVKARRLDLVESKRKEIEDLGEVPVITVHTHSSKGAANSDAAPVESAGKPRVSSGAAVEAMRHTAIEHFTFSEVSHDDLLTRARERRRARGNLSHSAHPPSSASTSPASPHASSSGRLQIPQGGLPKIGSDLSIYSHDKVVDTSKINHFTDEEKSGYQKKKRESGRANRRGSAHGDPSDSGAEHGLESIELKAKLDNARLNMPQSSGDEAAAPEREAGSILEQSLPPGSVNSSGAITITSVDSMFISKKSPSDKDIDKGSALKKSPSDASYGGSKNRVSKKSVEIVKDELDRYIEEKRCGVELPLNTEEDEEMYDVLYELKELEPEHPDSFLHMRQAKGYVKTEQDKRFLKRAFRGFGYFKSMNDAEIAECVNSMQLYNFLDGENVALQGDAYGTHFFVGHSGTFTKTVEKDGHRLESELLPNDIFGETVLYLQGGRLASVRACVPAAHEDVAS